MMTCPHHDRKLKCFGEFVGLNRRKWEKSAVVHMATVLGISSGVLEVDPVDFLLYLMPLIGSQRSEPTKKIKAAFEELLSREQNLSIDEKELSKLEVELPIEEEEVEGEEEEEEEVEEDEEDEEEEEEDEEEESMVTYRTFRKHLLLLHDVYDIFSNDSSTPTLTDSVDPLWKYTLKTLTKRKVKSNRTRKTSLKSCFAWVTAESEKRSKSKPPPTGAGPRTKTRRRKQAEAPSGAPPAKKPARRVGGHQQAVVTESNGAVDSMPPKGGARSGGRRRTQTTTTASRGTVDAMPSRGAQRGACRHRSAESSGVADASPNPDESPSPAAGEAAAEAEEPAIVWTPSPHGGSIPNGRPRRDSAAADEAVDGDQAPANDRTTSPDAQPHLAAAESDGEVGEDDVQAESDGVYESSISFEWEYGAAASDGKVEEDDDALANDPDRASVMSDDGIEPANSREADRTTVNSNESPSRNADKPNEADEDIMSATYRTPTSRYGSPLCDDGTLNETVVDEDTAATYGTPTSSPDGVAASTNVAEMTGSQQQQLPLHPHHQGTQGGMPGRVRFDERHNTIHFFDPPQSGLHTGLFESPDEDGTPSDAPPQSSAPDSSSAHTSSSARPNHAHFSEGAAERVNEPIEPLRSSQSSRPADDDAMVPFDTRVLRAKYKYEDGEVTRAWNDKNERIKQLKLVAYRGNLVLRELRPRVERDPREGDVSCLAASAFKVIHYSLDYPSYLAGRIVLPPRGIKGPDSVGMAAQTCTVVSCQPNALEVAYGDPDEDEGSFDPATATRFFLCPGDWFRITPGSTCRIENHSTNYKAEMTFTLIQNNAPEGVLQDAGLNGEETDDSASSSDSDNESSVESKPGDTPSPQRKRQPVESFDKDNFNISSNSAGGMDDDDSHPMNGVRQLASPSTSLVLATFHTQAASAAAGFTTQSGRGASTTTKSGQVVGFPSAAQRPVLTAARNAAHPIATRPGLAREDGAKAENAGLDEDKENFNERSSPFRSQKGDDGFHRAFASLSSNSRLACGGDRCGTAHLSDANSDCRQVGPAATPPVCVQDGSERSSATNGFAQARDDINGAVSRRNPAADAQVHPLELGDMLAASQAENECIHKFMHKFVAKLRNANATIKDQAVELAVSQSENERLLRVVQERDLKLAESEGTISEQTGQLSSAGTPIAEQETQMNELRGELSATRTQITEQDAQISEQGTLLSAARNQINVLATENTELTTQNAELAAQNTELTTQNTELTTQNTQQAAQLDAARATIAALQQELQQRNATLASIRALANN